MRQQLFEYLGDTFDIWFTSVENHFSESLSKTSEDIEFYKRYSFAGHYDIIRGWINGGCKTPIDVLVRFIVKQSAVNANLFCNADPLDMK